MSKSLEQEKTNLWTRCKEASSWVIMGTGSNQMVRMLRRILLTYIIDPDNMGLWFLMITAIGCFNEFTDTGVKHALIQNPRGDTRDYMCCGWVIIFVRSLFLIGLLYITAPIIARVFEVNFDQVELQSILRLGCLLFLFDGLSSISFTVMQKALILRPIFVIQITANIIGLLTSLFFAWRLQHARGIVYGEIICSGVICLLSYVVHPFRPRLCWNRKIFLELLAYGGMTYLVALVDTLALRLDGVLIGLFDYSTGSTVQLSGQGMVGLYGLAVAVIMAPTVLISQLSITVGFPALSQLQKDFTALRRGLIEIIKMSQFVALPVFGLLYLLAPDIVKILPQKYAETGMVIRYLSITGFSVVFIRQLTPALYAINKVHWCILRGLAHIIVFVLLIYPFSQKWGLAGLCWAGNLAHLTSAAVILMVTLRQLHWPMHEWLSDMSIFVRPLLGSCTAFFMVNILFGIAELSWNESALVRFGSSSVGFLAYGLLSLRTYVLPLTRRLKTT